MKNIEELALGTADVTAITEKAISATIEEVARGKENTMPALLECVEAYATLGEMCDVLRGVFGEQKEFLVF